MPAIYVHSTFGRHVFEELQGELKEVIANYYPSFEIGLQGPDPLFYHRPYAPDATTKEGSLIHKQACSTFLAHAIDTIHTTGVDSGEYAYLMGFVCHFVLDSECHPYIDEYVSHTRIGHIALESEFEKYMMRVQGKDPFAHDVSACIPTDAFTAASMAPFYSGLTPTKARTILREMHFGRRVLHTSKQGKQRVLSTLFRWIKHEEDMGGLLLSFQDSEECVKSNVYLLQAFHESIPLAVQLIMALDDTIQKGTPLPRRFHRNFETL